MLFWKLQKYLSESSNGEEITTLVRPWDIWIKFWITNFKSFFSQLQLTYILWNWNEYRCISLMITLVQVMLWCRQATTHYLSQCWPRSMSLLGLNYGDIDLGQIFSSNLVNIRATKLQETTIEVFFTKQSLFFIYPQLRCHRYMRITKPHLLKLPTKPHLLKLPIVTNSNYHHNVSSDAGP